MRAVISTLTIDSPVGPLALSSRDGRLTGLGFTQAAPGGDGDGPLHTAARQLGEYFAGTRREFDLPLAPPTEGLDALVLGELAKVPYGRTVSYKELTVACGLDVARVRDVGAALGRNPLVVVLPCHRVIGSDGSLTGFGGGLGRKRALLDLEAPQLQLA
jgi:methylated-DNA-[protein]-cysteine S-methyltransferase